MEKRRGKSSDRIAQKLVFAAVVLSLIAGVAYTKADRTVTFSVQRSAFGDLARSTQNAEPSEWQTIRMRVTGYCPCPKCCGEYADGITANGHKIKPGDTFVAADKRFAFGTEMIIPGYNNSQPVKVLDRGGAIRGNKLDAFFHTHQEALEWGVQYLDVQVRVN